MQLFVKIAVFLNTVMVKLVDTMDLKSINQKWLYGFDSHSRYKIAMLFIF